MKVWKYAGLSVLLLVGNINLAQAIPYSVSGSFQNPGVSGSSSLYYLFNNDQGSDARLSAVAEFGWGIDLNTLASSRFQFDGANGNTSLPADSSLVINLGSFSYTNLPTVSISDVVTVDLNLNLALGDPASSVKQLDFNYAMKINNTSGTGTPDSMQIVSMTDKSMFTINGMNYGLELLGFGRGITGLTVNENDTARRQLFARIDQVSAVPLPTSVWLFSSALVGLIGISRRTGKKA
ncbi:MAG: hypothetical protein GXP11_07215 [Gammaproteobacteria bacterium]|nr:hypothetical protein [Gammaproteobacteria bacterium]